jgi:rhamnosyltransferase
MDAPKISVVIPTKNDAIGIARCIDGILRQTILVNEILVIDSGSSDGTQTVAKSYPQVRVIEIPPKNFNHGETRNFGVRETSGEFILFTVQDAWAYDEHWIENLLSGFIHERIAAVWGAQVVAERPDTDPIEWFRPISSPALHVFDFRCQKNFQSQTSDVQLRACSVDNVTALYRRTALSEIGFRQTTYGEDAIFGRDAHNSGWGTAYNPAARVFHYHLEDYKISIKKSVLSSILRHTLFGVVPNNPKFQPIQIAWQLFRRLGPNIGGMLFWWNYRRNQVRGVRDGVRIFLRARQKGTDAISELQKEYGTTPPIPLKPNGFMKT